MSQNLLSFVYIVNYIVYIVKGPFTYFVNFMVN